VTVLFIQNTVINSHMYMAGEIYTLAGADETTQIAAGACVAYPSTASATNGQTVTAAIATGPVNNAGAAALYGYLPGVTTQIIATPAAGGSTVNGLDATNVRNGHTVLWQNASTADSITFAHLAAGSLAANRFSNMNAATVSILPLGAARCTYLTSKWQFA
jgi:hypothetical protein